MPQKVLIIEDSADSMNVITTLIKLAKLKPVGASSLTEARHMFSSSAPEDFLYAIVNYTLPDAPPGLDYRFCYRLVFTDYSSH